jgi:hypothetical protein
MSISIDYASAFRGYLQNYCISQDTYTFDPMMFLDECIPHVCQIVQDALAEHRAVLLFQSLVVTMEKMDGTEMTANFNHPRHYFFMSTHIEEILAELAGVMVNNCITFQEQGSGWMVKRVECLDVHLDPYIPLTAASYVKLPKQIIKKSAVLNIENKDVM